MSLEINSSQLLDIIFANTFLLVALLFTYSMVYFEKQSVNFNIVVFLYIFKLGAYFLV